MIGSPILVIGIFWLGWTGQYANIPWYVPALSTIILGAGISLIFMSFLSYLVDTYLMYSASALSANTAIRSAVAAAFPLFTVQLFTNLGVNWACTLIGCIALLFLPSPFLFYKYGARIRAHSKFAPCIDLQVAAELENEKKDYSKPWDQDNEAPVQNSEPTIKIALPTIIIVPPQAIYNTNRTSIMIMPRSCQDLNRCNEKKWPNNKSRLTTAVYLSVLYINLLS